MIKPEQFYNSLLENGVSFFTGVPDSLLGDICAYIKDHSPNTRNIMAVNEGSAIGLATGYHLATGQIPLVYMQNSGLGNATNPLLSLADGDVYKIPLLLLIGWRGEPGVKDEPQHVKQGKVTLKALDSIGVPSIVLDNDPDLALEQIKNVTKSIKKESIAHAIVVRKATFEKYRLNQIRPCDYPLSREDALKIVVSRLGDDDIVVSTTGKLSRELFEYREETKEGHSRDFLTVGSMGHSSAIALGISNEKPERNVFCFDGDGAVLMHTGTLATIGNSAHGRYRHIVFNNGAHESVGGQPTVAFDIDLPSIAKACGYDTVASVTSETGIIDEMERFRDNRRTAFLEIRVRMDSRSDLGRPTTSPIENKTNFMTFLK